jgi:hypothetical protein
MLWCMRNIGDRLSGEREMNLMGDIIGWVSAHL